MRIYHSPMGSDYPAQHFVFDVADGGHVCTSTGIRHRPPSREYFPRLQQFVIFWARSEVFAL